ncbi:MAG TPA: lipid-binding SYLF domain-containing protein [Bryobacteraceae bacterium]|nr:lipid-binding SYLF domain-containing protein [Bryobacteraceae bacterium]
MSALRGISFGGTVCGWLMCMAMPLTADLRETPVADRLSRAAEALTNFVRSATGTPRELLAAARCIAVVPHGTEASGFISCRASQTAPWSSPGAIRVEGGILWHVPGMEPDLILLAMSSEGAASLSSGQVLLGGLVETYPGPVHPDQNPRAMVGTPAILTYKDSSGKVEGILLGGATVAEDLRANADLYGRALGNSAILRPSAAPKPSDSASRAVERFRAALPGNTK